MATLKELYDALTQDGVSKHDTYKDFEVYMTSGPNGGYDHRKQMYDSLKAIGYPLPDTYEKFSRSLFSGGKKTAASAAAKPGAPAQKPTTIKDAVAKVNTLAQKTGVKLPTATPGINKENKARMEKVSPKPNSAPKVAADIIETFKATPIHQWMTESGQVKPSKKETPKTAEASATPKTAEDEFLETLAGTQQFFDEMKETRERFKRLQEASTPEGRKRIRLAEQEARMRGIYRPLLGIGGGGSSSDEIVGDGGSGGVEISTQSPQIYGVKFDPVSGKMKAEWLLPNGALTTDPIEADRYERLAIGARLQHRQEKRQKAFKERMKANKLNPDDHYDVRKQEILDRIEINREAQYAADKKVADKVGGFFKWDSERGFFENIAHLTAFSILGYEGAADAVVDNDEAKNLKAENYLLAKTLKRIDASKLKRSEGMWNGVFDWSNNAKNLKQGALDTLTDVDLYVGGMESLGVASRLMEIDKKCRNGIPLSRSEMNLAYAAMLNIEADQNLKTPHGYTAAVTTVEMVPFMIQMMMNPTSGLGKAWARKFGNGFIRKLGSAAIRSGTWNKIKYVGGKAVRTTLGEIGSSAFLAGTLQAPATAADAMNRYMGSPQFDDEQHITGFGGEHNWAKAIAKAGGAATIENYTEMLGEHFGVLAGALGSGISKGAKAVGLGSVVDAVSTFANKISTSAWGKALGNLEKKAQWHGTVGEVLEEEAGIVLNSLIVGDKQLSNLTDAEHQIDIVLGVGLFGGFMSAVKTIGYPASRAHYGRQLRRADRLGSWRFADEWEAIRDEIDSASERELNQKVRDLMDSYAKTKEMREAILKYAQALMAARGVDIAIAKATAEGTMTPAQQQAEENFMDGADTVDPQARADAKRRLELAREKAVGALSEDIVNDVLDSDDALTLLDYIQDEEGRQIALDYLNAKQAYQGMIQGVRDDIDSRIAQSDAEIDSRVNRQTGKIQTATLQDGRQVSIIDGEIVLLDDGSIDKDASKGDILYRDNETGKAGYIDISEIASVEAEQLDPESLKEEARERIRQEAASAAAAEIDGETELTAGTEYSFLDWDGNLMSVKLLGPALDAEGNPVEGSFLIELPDGSTQTLSEADLRAKIEEAERKRVADEQETRRETERVDRERQRALEQEERRREQEKASLENPARNKDLLPETYTHPYFRNELTAVRFEVGKAGAQGMLYRDAEGNDALVLVAVDENTYVGYFVEYDSDGRPTNRWSAKFQNTSGSRETFRDMMQTARGLLPAGHELTEHTSVSTDGLRNLANQLKHGYELQYDEDGRLVTQRVRVNMMAKENALGLTGYRPGAVSRVVVRDEAKQREVESRLLPFLEPFGLGMEAISWEDGTLYVEHPVLKFTEEREESSEETPSDPHTAPESSAESSSESAPESGEDESAPAELPSAEEFSAYDEQQTQQGYQEAKAEAGELSDEELDRKIEETGWFVDGYYWGQNKAYREEKARRQGVTPESNDGSTAANTEDPAEGAAEAATQNQGGTAGTALETSVEAPEAGPAATPSALEQIPRDDEGEPIFEAVDPKTAWQALVEDSYDEAEAEHYARGRVRQLAKDVKKAQKAYDNIPTTGSRSEYKAKREAAREVLAQVHAQLAHWEAMLAEYENSRKEEDAPQIITDTPAPPAAVVPEEAQPEEAAPEESAPEQTPAPGKATTAAADASLVDVPEMAEDLPADARARGWRRNGADIVSRQQPLTPVEGKETAVDFSDSDSPQGRYVLIEAEELQPSHMQGQVNPLFFIDEAQPKARTDHESILKEEKIANGLEPEKVAVGLNAYSGAPVVNARGEVIQGNNRSAALRLMYDTVPGRSDAYRAWLADNANQFGLTREQVEGMKNPVLVRMLDVSDEEAIRLGQKVSTDIESGGQRRIETSQTLEQLDSQGLMAQFFRRLMEEADEDATLADVIGANGVEVLKWLNSLGIVNNTQAQTAISAGRLTEAGREDLRSIVENALFRNAPAAVRSSFVQLPAAAQKAILATAWRDYNSPQSERMMGELHKAIILFDRMMQADQRFAKSRTYEEARRAAEGWGAQTEFDQVTGELILPSKKYSNFAFALASLFRTQKQNSLKKHFNDMFDFIQGIEEEDLFGKLDETPAEERTLAAAVKKVLDLDYKPVQADASVALEEREEQAQQSDQDKSDNPTDNPPNTDKNDGKNGSDPLDVDPQAGQTGQQGGSRNPGGRKQGKKGTRPADSGAGAPAVAPGPAQVDAQDTHGDGTVTPDKPADAHAAEFELTLADLDAIDIESEEAKSVGIDQNVIDSVRDYLNGDRDTWAQMSYRLVKEYVRNTRNNRGADSLDADSSQLAGPDAQTDGQPAGGEGSKPGGVDRTDSPADVSGSGESGQDGPRSGGTLPGTQSDSGVEGETPSPGTDAAGSADSAGGRRTGSRGGNVRKPRGKKGSRSDSRTDGAGTSQTQGVSQQGDSAKAPVGLTDKLGDVGQSMVDDALSTLSDILKNPGMTKPGRLNDVTSIIAGLGVNAVRFLGATGQLACGLVFRGIYKFAKWRAEMHRNLEPLLTEHTDLSDKQIAEFIRSAWDMKYTYRGERKKISEWAAQLEVEELRRLAQMSIAEKRKAQAAAEEIEVEIGNLDNIRETLPFLLPAQHEDVEKAERQMFSAEHADREHGYGKGYMFTNGTGTGKTYTGLGIVKRFLKQGKGRVLIVTVNDTKISDWIKDASNLGIEAKQLADTTSKGEGVVVTQYANLRQNYALLEDEFDLIIYDESHKLMENQEGQSGSTAEMHHMIAARDAQAVIEREMENSEIGKTRRRLRDEIKKLTKLRELLNTPASLLTDAQRDFIQQCGYTSMEQLERDILDFAEEEKRISDEIDQQVEAALADEGKRQRAEEISRKTKTVFLSATPFNTPSSLDYAEGYIFSYPEGKEGKSRRDRKNDFLSENFDKSHKFNKSGDMVRLTEDKIADPAGAEEQEIAFSNHLQDELQTMSGRMLDSAFDYSRSFPKFDMPMAKRVNQAMSEIVKGPLADAFKKTLLNYNYATAFWEIIKTGFIIDRIREHVKLGRKVVVFHRRKASTQEIHCPFLKGLEEALASKSGIVKAAAMNFAMKYSDLLEWEAKLDYTYPQDRILREFVSKEELAEYEAEMKKWEEACEKASKAGKKLPKQPRLKSKQVGIFNGDQTASEKQAAVDNFNLADSGQDVIVVQVQSGKEGISLHDTDGKHQRVMLSLALPQSPIEFIQAEGRIYRVGNQSDAIFEYPLLGIDRELYDFAMKINGRSQTSENLAMGSRSRGLRDSITRGVLGSTPMPVSAEQGKGGKMIDSRQTQTATGFDHAMTNWMEWRDAEQDLPYDDRSIPDPLGLKMMEWAGIQRGETVLVPYAGEGWAARYVPASSKLIALETESGKLARLAALMGGGGRKILGENFRTEEEEGTEFSTRNKADVVIIKTKSGVIKNGPSKAHRSWLDIRKAIQHTEDSGRVVAIVPTADLKGVNGLISTLEKNHRPLNCALRSVTDLPADIFGQETSVVVIDVSEDKTIADGLANSFKEIEKAEAGAGAEQSLANLRDSEVPRREIDPIAKIIKRTKPLLHFFRESSLVKSFKVLGQSSKEVYMTRHGVTIRTTKYLLPKSPDQMYTRYAGLNVNFADLASRSELEDIAKRWAATQSLLEMSEEEFEAYYRGDIPAKKLPEVRDFLKNICKVIEAVTGKTTTQLSNIAEGKVENQIKKDMNAAEFQDLFRTLDSGNVEIDALAARVFDVASKIEGLKFKLSSGRNFSSHNVMAHYVPGRNEIELNADNFNSIRFTDAEKAQTILHETIHAVTCWALSKYKNASEQERAEMGPIADACRDIEQVFKAINNDSFRAQLQAGSKLRDNAFYGLTDEYEMLAEMANPAFRAALKAKRLWRQLVNGIKKLFGIDVLDSGEGATSAYDVLNSAIETILNNFDPAAYAAYTAAPLHAEHRYELNEEERGMAVGLEKLTEEEARNVEDYLDTYPSADIQIINSVNEIENFKADEEEKQKLEEKAIGFFDPVTKKIYIFASRTARNNILRTIHHENVHHLCDQERDNNPVTLKRFLRSFREALLNDPYDGGTYRRGLEDLKKSYSPWQIDEELFAIALEEAFGASWRLIRLSKFFTGQELEYYNSLLFRLYGYKGINKLRDAKEDHNRHNRFEGTLEQTVSGVETDSRRIEKNGSGSRPGSDGEVLFPTSGTLRQTPQSSDTSRAGEAEGTEGLIEESRGRYRQVISPGLFDNMDEAPERPQGRVRVSNPSLFDLLDESEEQEATQPDAEQAKELSESERRADEANRRIDEFLDRAYDLIQDYSHLARLKPEIAEALMDRMRGEVLDAREELRNHLQLYYLEEGNQQSDAEQMATDMARRVFAELTLSKAWPIKIEADSEFEIGPDSSGKSELITAGGEKITFSTTATATEDSTSEGKKKAATRQPAPLRPLAPGEFCYVERKFTETQEFGFTGAERIESLDDVAFLFRCLEDYSIENTFAVLVKDGEPLIVHLGMGGASYSTIDMTALRGAIDAYGADKVYFIHNHPSGSLTPSIQDQKVVKSLEGMLGDKLAESIIIDVTSGRYSVFNASGHYEKHQADPVNNRAERHYSALRQNRQERTAEGRDVESLRQVRGASQVASFVAGRRLGNGLKISYLLLSRDNRVIGNLHTPYMSYGEDMDAMTEEMVRMAVRYGASSVIPYGNVWISMEEASALTEAIKKKSGDELKVMDVMTIEGIYDIEHLEYTSALDQGKIAWEGKESYSDPGIRQRKGSGPKSDHEVSFENDPWSKAWGESLRTKKQEQVYARRERRRMAERARSLAGQLGLDIEIYDDADSLPDPAEERDARGRKPRTLRGRLKQLFERKRQSKGWYDTRTGKIHIILGNHVSALDVEQTILHEAVGHYGLRKLFGDRFDAFLDAVYEKASGEIRDRIALLASRNGWNRRVATEEYLAALAENTDLENHNSGWWYQIKKLFLDFLRGCGFSLNMELTDNELRYVLWMSYKNLKEPGAYSSFLGLAERTAREAEWQVGNYAERGERGDYSSRVSESENISEINDSFNEDLEKFEKGELDNTFRFELGMPSKYLLSAGFPNLAISMRQSLLKKKAAMERHKFSASSLKNLVEAIQKPLAIFEYSRSNMRNLIIDLTDGGKHFLVGVTLNYKAGDIEINSISGLFPKDNAEWLKWIQDGKAIRIDGKEKIQSIIDSQRTTNTVESERIGLDLNETTKIVKDFENPKLDEEILFRDGDFTARDRVTVSDVYERMLARGSWQFREAMQDSMLGLKTLYESIVTEGKKEARRDFRIEEVAGFENAYLYENRMSSTNNAEQHAYFTTFMQPLLESVRELCGTDARERRILTDYMMAKHGLERNDYMRAKAAAEGRKTDRDFAGLTDLTGIKDWKDAEDKAREMVDQYENAADPRLLSALWSDVKAATQATLTKIYTSGMISEKTYNDVLSMYQFYIPLRGWDETTADEQYGYLTTADGPLREGNVFKPAKGRRSKADDPIAFIAKMADDAIRQGNRNIMKQRFLNFVLGHPSDLVSVNQIWLEKDAVSGEWKAVFADLEPDMSPAEVEAEIAKFEAKMEGLAASDPTRYKKGRDARNIPYRVRKEQLREHQVMVHRGGTTYVLTVNGNPRAAQALNGLTNPDTKVQGAGDWFASVGTRINRLLSSAYTTRNPDFVVSNFLRDMVYSNTQVWVKENPRYAMAFHKNVAKLNPARLMALFYHWEKGGTNKLDDTNPIHKAFKEFMLNGGETGYTAIKDIERYKRTIEAELRKHGNIVRAELAALGNAMEMMNRAVENCARFAAYMTSREMGRTIDRAIYDAKEISVNFNKKGAGGRFFTAANQTWLGKVGSSISWFGRGAFAFWNASVQGLTNYMRGIKRNPAKAIPGAALLFGFGFCVPMLNQFLKNIIRAIFGGDDGDDDDDKNAYYNLPEYVRRSNLCVWAGNKWITWPLPIEYRALYGMGELAYGVMSGNERYSDAELTRHMASQFSQILPLDMMEGGGGLHPFIPTIAKPLVEAWMNKSWTGMPIYRENTSNEYDPQWEKAISNTDQDLVNFTRWLNETTRDDVSDRGKIDLNPAIIEYMLNGYLGGIFSFPMKIKKSYETKFGKRDFEWRNTPFLNRVLKEGDERTANRKLQNEFFKFKEEADETRHLERKYENAKDEGILEYAEKIDFLYNSERYGRYQVYDYYSKDLSDLNKERKQAKGTPKEAQIEAKYYALMRECVEGMRDPEKFLKRMKEQQEKMRKEFEEFSM